MGEGGGGQTSSGVTSHLLRGSLTAQAVNDGLTFAGDLAMGKREKKSRAGIPTRGLKQGRKGKKKRTRRKESASTYTIEYTTPTKTSIRHTTRNHFNQVSAYNRGAQESALSMLDVASK